MEQSNILQTESGVDTRSTCRTGFPALATLPVETSVPLFDVSFLPRGETTKSQILHILDQNNVHVLDVFFCYRFNKGVPEKERKRTLLVYSDLREQGQSIEVWRQATGAVRDFVARKNISDVALEIMDIRVNEEIKTEVISSNEKEVLEAWTEFVPRIVDCLTEQHRNWLTLDLLHRDWIGAQKNIKATVVICAPDANDAIWWDTTIPALRSLLPAFLGIELCFLDTIRAHNGSVGDDDKDNINWKEFLEKQSYRTPGRIPIGASCGRRWREEEPVHATQKDFCLESGTLGGLIKFSHSAKEFGLSNHHVFFEGKDCNDQEKKPITEALEPSSELLHSRKVPVFSPAATDWTLKQREMSSLIKDEEGMRMLSAEESESENVEEPDITMQALLKKQHVVANIDPYIGTVYASSGQRSVKYRAMEEVFWGTWESDWSLVEIQEKKSIAQYVYHPHGGNKEQVTTYQTISPFKQYNVKKYGKSSGKTIGIVSAASTVQRGKNDPLLPIPSDAEKEPSVVRYKEPGEFVQRKQNVEKEQHRICYAIRSREKGPGFMTGGDSGSLILLDEDAESSKDVRAVHIVGLGFGTNEAIKMAYMSPFDFVVQDIEFVTGHTVVHPQNRGQATPLQPLT